MRILFVFIVDFPAELMTLDPSVYPDGPFPCHCVPWTDSAAGRLVLGVPHRYRVADRGVSAIRDDGTQAKLWRVQPSNLFHHL